MCLTAGLLLANGARAQVGNEMRAFRNKAGVSVTMLTPSLYNLYRSSASGLDAEEALRGIGEVNVMQVRIAEAGDDVVASARERLAPVLGDVS